MPATGRKSKKIYASSMPWGVGVRIQVQNRSSQADSGPCQLDAM